MPGTLCQLGNTLRAHALGHGIPRPQAHSLGVCLQHSGLPKAAPVSFIALGCLGRTQMLCLLTQQVSSLQTQHMSWVPTRQIQCLQTHARTACLSPSEENDSPTNSPRFPYRTSTHSVLGHTLCAHTLCLSTHTLRVCVCVCLRARVGHLI